MKKLTTGLLLAAGLSFAQTPDKVTVPFSDPSRPGTIKARLINGGITVKAYNGKEVIVEATAGKPEADSERSEGIRRLAISSTGLTVEEENNVMSVGAGSHNRTINLTIQVPTRTSLKLHAINGGNIVVEGVQGEIEVNNINGNVTLTNVAGSTVAHALNGRLQASFTRVEPKPMSFSSLNGRIDVTFPADLKANVKIKSERGEVYSDFEIALKAGSQPVVEDSRSKNGKYQVRVDKAVYGAINGGGPEIQFSNFNGSIYIRKGK